MYTSTFLVYCPMGEEEDLSNPKTCVKCNVSTYKDNADPGMMCQPCTKNYVASAEGSITINNCSICKLN